MLQRCLLLALLLSGLFLTACEDNPTGPEFETFTQSGTVPHMGTHFGTLALPDTTTVLVEVTDITGIVPTVNSLGFGLGTVNDAGSCTTTFRDTAVVGSKFSFRLVANTYCFSMFDIGTIPTGTTADYSLLIDP